MINNQPACLGLFLGSFLLFIIGTMISVFNYKNRFNMKYNFRNTFPYELNYKGTFKDNLFGNVLLCISAVAMIVFFIFFDRFKNNGFLIFTMIGGIIAAVDFIVLIFMPLNILKGHLFAVVVLFAIALLSTASTAAGNFFRLYDDKTKFNYLAAGLIATLLCIFAVVITLNPKLKYWAQLSPEPNKDGTKSYKRPKYFVLAYSEWVLIAIIYLNMIPNFIGMF